MKPSIIPTISNPVKNAIRAFEGTTGAVLKHLHAIDSELSVKGVAKALGISCQAASRALIELRRCRLITQRNGHNTKTLNRINMDRYNALRAAIATCAATIKGVK